jgi:hypothetical protein
MEETTLSKKILGSISNPLAMAKNIPIVILIEHSSIL